MATYTIRIKNESNRPRRFLLFQDLPKPSNGPSDKVFTNVYQRSPKIESGNGSSTTFSMKQEYFAIYGTSSDNDDGTVRVYTSASMSAKLGPGGTVAVVSTQDGEGTDPIWDTAAATSSPPTGAKGGFSIVTDNTFKYPNPSKSASTPANIYQPQTLTPLSK